MTDFVAELRKQRDDFDWLARPGWALGRLWCEYNRQFCNRTGTKVIEKDWDDLIIFDACRYDWFRDVSSTDGEFSTGLPAAPNTIAFLERNFGDDEFPDTVYVSGHLNLKQIDAKFHDRVRLSETHREVVYSGEFDDRSEVVFPETMAEETLQTQTECPNNRLIVHFMQLYTPLIGENEAKEVFDFDGYWYEQLKRRNISRELAEASYKDSLKRTLPAVEASSTAPTGRRSSRSTTAYS